MKLTQTGLPRKRREIDRPASDLRDDERRGDLADVEQARAAVGSGDAARRRRCRAR